MLFRSLTEANASSTSTRTAPPKLPEASAAVHITSPAHFLTVQRYTACSVTLFCPTIRPPAEKPRQLRPQNPPNSALQAFFHLHGKNSLHSACRSASLRSTAAPRIDPLRLQNVQSSQPAKLPHKIIHHQHFQQSKLLCTLFSQVFSKRGRHQRFMPIRISSRNTTDEMV